MAAGWKAWKDQALKDPPKHVLSERSTNGPIQRSFRLGWIQGKRDDSKETQLIRWISKLTGASPPNNTDFGEWLRNGQILCKLINKLLPGSVSRINLRGEYAQRENISNFLKGCQQFGLREDECFSCNDLWESANLAQVTSTIFLLADVAHSRDKNVPLP